VYQAPSKTNMWTNGDIQTDVPVAANEESVPAVVVPEDESDDDYQVIAKKPKTAVDPASTSTPDVTSKTTTEDSSTDSTRDVATQHDQDMDVIEETAQPDRGPVTDDDWLRSRTNRLLELVEDDEQPAPAVSSPQHEVPESAPPAVAEEAEGQEQSEVQMSEAQALEVPASDEVDKIRETGRLYLRNLHFEVTEEELRGHFSKYGSLEEVSHNISFFLSTRAMMNIQIGTTDAKQMRLTVESILVDVFLILISAHIL
jgi:multiple RNA-binding domain-containing protein 1